MAWPSGNLDKYEFLTIKTINVLFHFILLYFIIILNLQTWNTRKAK